MANTLQELRKEAGYRTAKEFAEAADIPVPTYTRYEQDPSKIPVERAWLIADKLGCSIDAVVGREHIDVSAMRGEFQRYVDELSDEAQSLLWQFAAVFKGNEKFRAKTARREEEAKYDTYLSYYESSFFQSLDAGSSLGDSVIFGTDDEKRAAFEHYLIERAIARRPQKVDEIVNPQMNELWLNGGGYIEDDGEMVFFDDPRFAKRMEEIEQGMRESTEQTLENEDMETIAQIMSAYDRKHKPSNQYAQILERGEQAVREILGEIGDVKLTDITSSDKQ